MAAAAKSRKPNRVIEGLRQAVKHAIHGPDIAPAPKPAPKPASTIPEHLTGRLTDHELGGLFAEAFEAYDMADERVRFDSANRRWWFVPEKRNDHSVLLLQLKRLEDVRESTISTALLATEGARGLIEEAVRALDAGLA